jgi:hypothetical protein
MNAQGQRVDVLAVDETHIVRITDKAMEMMARRANAMTPYGNVTACDIASTVAADPTGDTAFYLAQLIAWGIEWFINFRRVPELLQIWGEKHV